ncbi:ABC transporter permease [Thioalkalivibrio sp. XN8]|uniref:ABC transporter permease n=1 Tax=Thioalkalivibrio sp. XN8 TaxID=2712863 RepID=UPI0013EABB7C|nr:ABC transporter permease [Thioalkalivibrio sp. XN8]NGP52537.1 ABC transporter permease [Thioalkalivibrio sp. XN8]
MNTLRQIWAVSLMNLRSVPQRWSTSLVIVVGIAGVVGVLTAILAMGEGFSATLGAAGKEDQAIVLRSGATSELTSGLSRETVDLIKRAPGVARGADGEPVASAEILVIADLPKAGTGTLANAPIRGVQPGAFGLRPEVRIIEGRNFEPGPRELIVGRGAASQFEGLEVGARVAFRDADWTIVGIFSAGGGAHESELWGDAETVMSAYRRGGFQSVTVQLESAESMEAFQAALADDPRLNVEAQTLRAYFSAQSRQMSTLINVLGYTVGYIMAIGALFGALNTMYAAISTRAREIATLRALGFGGTAIVTSVMIEALLLAVIGGAIGGGLAWALFNGYTVSTLGANFSQVAFDFKVTGELLAQGIAWSLVIGFLGGLFPAWRAARQEVTTALRSL